MSFNTMSGVVFAQGEPYFDHLMTQWYEPMVIDARDNSAVLFNLINRGKRDVYGKRVTMPVRFGRNHGVGAIQPGGKFPDSGKQGAQQYTFPIRHLYARAKMDGVTLDAVKGNNAAYLEATDFEIQGLTDDFIQQQQRMIYSDGSGRMAMVASSDVAAATIDIVLQTNQELPSPATDDTPPNSWFIEGQFIVCCDETGGTPIFGVVNSVDADGETINVSWAAGASLAPGVGDWVCFAANNDTGNTLASTGFRAEPQGIGGVLQEGDVADGNGLQIAGAPQEGSEGDVTAGGVGFQGQLASAAGAKSYNQGLVFDNNGTPRAISEALLQASLSDTERINNGSVDFILSYHQIYDNFFNSLVGQKRYPTATLSGGHKAMDFNGIPFVKDKHATQNRIFMLDLSQFYCHENVPFSIVNDDGRTWRAADDTDDMQIVFKNRYTFSVAVRNRAGSLTTDIT